MWHNETKEVKDLFTTLSGLVEKKHIEKFGEDYKYKPNTHCLVTIYLRLGSHSLES